MQHHDNHTQTCYSMRTEYTTSNSYPISFNAFKVFFLIFCFFQKREVGGGHSIQTFVQTLKSSVLPSLGELGKKKCMMQHNLRKELKWYCSPPSLPSALCLCHFLLSGHFSQQPVGRPIPLYSCHHVRLTRLSKLHFSELSTPALNTIRYHR